MKAVHYISWITVLMLSGMPLLDARVRPNGSRLWDFAKETIEQEADYIITQADIPLAISLPGVYRLAESVNALGQTVITINTSNVVLDLNGKVISGDTNGILIQPNVHNISIKNGFIEGAPTFSNRGIAIIGDSADIDISALQMRNFGATDAIYMGPDANRIGLNNLLVEGGQGPLIHADGAFNVIIEHCSLTFSNSAIILFTSVDSAEINNCLMNNGVVGVNLTASANCTMHHCQASSISNTGYLFDGAAQCKALNCSVSSSLLFGFYLHNASSGNIVENCIASEISNPSADETTLAAGFFIDTSSPCNKIINCEGSQISGLDTGFANAYGIVLQSTLSNLQTVTSFVSPNISFQNFSSLWNPSADFLVAGGLLDNNATLLLFNYKHALTQMTLTDTLSLSTLEFFTTWNPVSPYIAYSDGLSVHIVQFDRINEKFGAITASKTPGSVLQQIAWSADGKFLAIAGEAPGKIYIYQFNFTTGALNLVQSLSTPNSIAVVAWSSIANFLAAADTAGNLTIYSFNSNANLFTLTPVSNQAGVFGSSLDWSFDGLYLAVSSHIMGGDTVTIYQFDPIAQTLTQVAQMIFSGASIGFVRWSPDGNFIVLNPQNNIAIYAFSRQFNTLTFGTSQPLLFGLSGAWSPDGSLIAVSASQELAILSSLSFPTKNIIKNNIVYCINGESLAPGFGISGSSLENIIIGNQSYNNNFAYQFVTNVYNQGLSGEPTLIQNVALPPF